MRTRRDRPVHHLGRANETDFAIVLPGISGAIKASSFFLTLCAHGISGQVVAGGARVSEPTVWWFTGSNSVAGLAVVTTVSNTIFTAATSTSAATATTTTSTARSICPASVSIVVILRLGGSTPAATGAPTATTSARSAVASRCIGWGNGLRHGEVGIEKLARSARLVAP